MASLEVDRVRRCLEGFAEVRLAIVFGSVVNGTAGSDSDLDVAVLADRPLTAERRIEMIEALTMETGRPVDLIDLKTAGIPLIGEILAGGTRVLGTTEEYAKLVTRHLIDAADFLPIRDRILAERRAAWIGK